jgi:hypothetical protein
VVQDQPRQKVFKVPISTMIKVKCTGDVVQMVECLLCKYEALFQIPDPPKKKSAFEYICVVCILITLPPKI